MRIAQIAPLIERVPPKKYGGTERVVSVLTEELVARGHEVTLFASGDSITSAKLVSAYPRSLRESKVKDMYGLNIWTLMNIGSAFSRQKEFDIIHDHTAHMSLPTAQIATIPVLQTIHGALSIGTHLIFRSMRHPWLVSISNSQRDPAPDLHWLSTIYHGLPLHAYPFSDTHDGYLLCVGRITPEKGTHIAIEVAQILDFPLIIAAKLDFAITRNMAYFKEYVEPHLSERIRWVGEVDDEERNRLMSRAAGLLHPVTWREPFGLVMIEAMGCGCPVVAFDLGSPRELIVNGKTGFVVNDLEEMLDAVVQLPTINRAECRRHAIEHFNVKRMADGYEAAYRKILSRAAG